MPYTKEEAIQDQMMSNTMNQKTINNLIKIGRAIEIGQNDVKWARRAAAGLLWLPEEAIWLYHPWNSNAVRSDMALGRLRQEWKEAGYHFIGNGSMLANG
jgi:hypothetical protein